MDKRHESDEANRTQITNFVAIPSQQTLVAFVCTYHSLKFSFCRAFRITCSIRRLWKCDLYTMIKAQIMDAWMQIMDHLWRFHRTYLQDTYEYDLHQIVRRIFFPSVGWITSKKSVSHSIYKKCCYQCSITTLCFSLLETEALVTLSILNIIIIMYDSFHWTQIAATVTL